ncbi:hypothetical protein WJX74_003248 [Apatococcus lobatus]|uniref:Uncharacterized protein n=1 Tax=Apatococcus lobatus TaxID=904363 RepID=A0AAW1RS03_9CHLO
MLLDLMPMLCSLMNEWQPSHSEAVASLEALPTVTDLPRGLGSETLAVLLHTWGWLASVASTSLEQHDELDGHEALKPEDFTAMQQHLRWPMLALRHTSNLPMPAFSSSTVNESEIAAGSTLMVTGKAAKSLGDCSKAEAQSKRFGADTTGAVAGLHESQHTSQEEGISSQAHDSASLAPARARRDSYVNAESARSTGPAVDQPVKNDNGAPTDFCRGSDLHQGATASNAFQSSPTVDQAAGRNLKAGDMKLLQQLELAVRQWQTSYRSLCRVSHRGPHHPRKHTQALARDLLQPQLPLMPGALSFAATCLATMLAEIQIQLGGSQKESRTTSHRLNTNVDLATALQATCAYLAALAERCDDSETRMVDQATSGLLKELCGLLSLRPVWLEVAEASVDLLKVSARWVSTCWSANRKPGMHLEPAVKRLWQDIMDLMPSLAGQLENLESRGFQAQIYQPLQPFLRHPDFHVQGATRRMLAHPAMQGLLQTHEMLPGFRRALETLDASQSQHLIQMPKTAGQPTVQQAKPRQHPSPSCSSLVPQANLGMIESPTIRVTAPAKETGTEPKLPSLPKIPRSGSPSTNARLPAKDTAPPSDSIPAQASHGTSPSRHERKRGPNSSQGSSEKPVNQTKVAHEVVTAAEIAGDSCQINLQAPLGNAAGLPAVSAGGCSTAEVNVLASQEHPLQASSVDCRASGDVPAAGRAKPSAATSPELLGTAGPSPEASHPCLQATAPASAAGTICAPDMHHQSAHSPTSPGAAARSAIGTSETSKDCHGKGTAGKKKRRRSSARFQDTQTEYVAIPASAKRQKPEVLTRRQEEVAARQKQGTVREGLVTYTTLDASQEPLVGLQRSSTAPAPPEITAHTLSERALKDPKRPPVSSQSCQPSAADKPGGTASQMNVAIRSSPPQLQATISAAQPGSINCAVDNTGAAALVSEPADQACAQQLNRIVPTAVCNLPPAPHAPDPAISTTLQQHGITKREAADTAAASSNSYAASPAVAEVAAVLQPGLTCRRESGVAAAAAAIIGPAAEQASDEHVQLQLAAHEDNTIKLDIALATGASSSAAHESNDQSPTARIAKPPFNSQHAADSSQQHAGLLHVSDAGAASNLAAMQKPASTQLEVSAPTTAEQCPQQPSARGTTIVPAAKQAASHIQPVHAPAGVIHQPDQPCAEGTAAGMLASAARPHPGPVIDVLLEQSPVEACVPAETDISQDDQLKPGDNAIAEPCADGLAAAPSTAAARPVEMLSCALNTAVQDPTMQHGLSRPPAKLQPDNGQRPTASGAPAEKPIFLPQRQVHTNVAATAASPRRHLQPAAALQLEAQNCPAATGRQPMLAASGESKSAAQTIQAASSTGYDLGSRPQAVFWGATGEAMQFPCPPQAATVHAAAQSEGHTAAAASRHDSPASAAGPVMVSDPNEQTAALQGITEASQAAALPTEEAPCGVHPDEKLESSPGVTQGTMVWSAPKSHVSAIQPSQEELAGCSEAQPCMPLEAPSTFVPELCNEPDGKLNTSQPGQCGSSEVGQVPSLPHPPPCSEPSHQKDARCPPQSNPESLPATTSSPHTLPKPSLLSGAGKLQTHASAPDPRSLTTAVEGSWRGSQAACHNGGGDDDDAGVYTLTEQQSPKQHSRPHTASGDDPGVYALTEQQSLQQHSRPQTASGDDAGVYVLTEQQSLQQHSRPHTASGDDAGVYVLTEQQQQATPAAGMDVHGIDATTSLPGPCSAVGTDAIAMLKQQLAAPRHDMDANGHHPRHNFEVQHTAKPNGSADALSKQQQQQQPEASVMHDASSRCHSVVSGRCRLQEDGLSAVVASSPHLAGDRHGWDAVNMALTKGTAHTEQGQPVSSSRVVPAQHCSSLHGERAAASPEIWWHLQHKGLQGTLAPNLGRAGCCSHPREGLHSQLQPDPQELQSLMPRLAEPGADPDTDHLPAQLPRKRPRLHEACAHPNMISPRQARMASSGGSHGRAPAEGHQAVHPVLSRSNGRPNELDTGTTGMPALPACNAQDVGEGSDKPEQHQQQQDLIAPPGQLQDVCQRNHGVLAAHAHDYSCPSGHHKPPSEAQESAEQPPACHRDASTGAGGFAAHARTSCPDGHHVPLSEARESAEQLLACHWDASTGAAQSNMKQTEHAWLARLGGPARPLPPEDTLGLQPAQTDSLKGPVKHRTARMPNDPAADDATLPPQSPEVAAGPSSQLEGLQIEGTQALLAAAHTAHPPLRLFAGRDQPQLAMQLKRLLDVQSGSSTPLLQLLADPNDAIWACIQDKELQQLQKGLYNAAMAAACVAHIRRQGCGLQGSG